MLQDYRVFEMLTLAQDMGVFELRAACEDHVISTLSVDNACTFLTAVMDIHEKAGASLLYFTFIILLYRAYSIRKNISVTQLRAFRLKQLLLDFGRKTIDGKLPKIPKCCISQVSAIDIP